MSADRLRFTLDTNILVYSVDSVAGSKHRLATEIVDRAVECECCLTLQALSEFYAVVTRKGIVPPSDAAAQAIDWLDVFTATAASTSAVRFALMEAASGRVAYRDALLVATAQEAGCTVILTEDMADGTTLNGVAIHNPFTSPDSLTELTRQLLLLP